MLFISIIFVKKTTIISQNENKITTWRLQPIRRCNQTYTGPTTCRLFIVKTTLTPESKFKIKTNRYFIIVIFYIYIFLKRNIVISKRLKPTFARKITLIYLYLFIYYYNYCIKRPDNRFQRHHSVFPSLLWPKPNSARTSFPCVVRHQTKPVRCRTTTWRSRTWSGTRSCRPTPTLVPAATSFRSPRTISASARTSLAALAVRFTLPSSTISRTSPPPMIPTTIPRIPLAAPSPSLDFF